MPSSIDTAVPPVRRVAVILGLIAYLATGFIYVSSGLVVPGVALLVLWLAYLSGLWPAARLVAAWSWWVLAAAPAAVGFWWVYLLVGEALLGWTP